MKQKKYALFFLFAGIIWLAQTNAFGQLEPVSPDKAPAPYAESIDARQLPTSGFNSADDDRVAGLREAGIRNDRTKIPALLDALQHPVKYAMLVSMNNEVKTALHALAQMGATEAIPSINTLIKATEVKGFMLWNVSPDQIHDIAKAAKARLLAEAKASNIEDSAMQARAKVNEFYRQLGMTPIEFKQATDKLTGSEYDTSRHYSDYSPYAGSVTFYALRELADMIYRGNYRDYMTLATVKTLDFSKDPATALKLKVAQVPKPDRAQWLVNNLISREMMIGDADMVAQLASDEGKAATTLVAARLRLMNANREKYMYVGKYKSDNRFRMLTDFLYYNGAVEQKEVVALVYTDEKGGLGDWAKAKVAAMDSGVRRQYVAGY